MPAALSLIELAALIYFFAAWSGYAHYARYRASTLDKSSLSRSLRNHREAWVARMLKREIRMTDASLLANQERVVGFFASTTLLLLAAVLTALTTSTQIAELTSHIPFATTQNAAQVEAKFAVLLLILVFAFFKVTWSLRQYGFAAIVMGGAPDFDEPICDEQRQAYISNLAKLMDSAGHNNNSGLRAYYFALSLVCWLIGTIPFIVATSVTVVVLYTREIKSNTVTALHNSYIPISKE